MSDYRNVPPPSGGGAVPDFAAALAKARAIAQNIGAAKDKRPNDEYYDEGPSNKRSSYEDDRYGGSERDRDRDRDYDRDRERDRDYERDRDRDRDRDYHRDSSSHRQLGPHESTTENYFFPNNIAGRVIGKAGENLSRMQSESGCRIEVIPDQGAVTRQARLTGTLDQIAHAKRLIKQIEDGMLSNTMLHIGGQGAHGDVLLVTPDGTKVVDIPIPSNKVGLVIGKAGETIKRLQAESGARMQMIQDQPTAELKPLRVNGTDDQIERVRKLVAELIGDKPSHDDGFDTQGILSVSSGQIATNLSKYRSVEAKVPVPRGLVGSIIGRSGEMIKRIQAETGARVQFDPADLASEERECKISGIQDNVDRAEAMVKEILAEAMARTPFGGPRGPRDEFSSMASGSGPREVVKVPTAVAGLVIGRGGETIRQIQQQSGAYIVLNRDTPPDMPDREFAITGTQEQIDLAKKFIMDRVAMADRGRAGFPPGPGGFGGPRPYNPYYQQGGPAYGAQGQYPPYGAAPQYGQYPPHHQHQHQQQGGAYDQYGAQHPYDQQHQQGAANSAAAGGNPPPPQGDDSKPAPPPPASGQPGSALVPGTKEYDDLAVANSYPTHEQYLQFKDWYNGQGYFGVLPPEVLQKYQK